ncbi:MAG TPA: hypothetical protein VN455_10180 [Methanotrichaceae archaeon]|nr:hypothetical protein [Methanotrichaceae archaeon]
MRRLITALLLVLYILPVAVQAGGVLGAGSSGGSSSGGGGGGGGHAQESIETFIARLESWKTQSPDKFDYVKKLLFKEAFTTSKYVLPLVLVDYPSKNMTVSRSDEVWIGAVVRNDNSIEIRRAIYLTLEIQEPGEKAFKPVKAGTQIIQVNDYSDTNNVTERRFPELNTFRILTSSGDVRLRIKATDGQNTWNSSDYGNYHDGNYYSVLPLKVYNIPPAINNTTMGVNPYSPKWDDYVEYTATMVDKAQDTVNITLQVIKDNRTINISKPFPGDAAGTAVTFSTKDAAIFNESDAGKNFTYRFSCDDGISNATWTEVKDGPHLRQNPKIKVKDPWGESEDSNYYWWQSYRFGIKAKSQNPEGEDLTVSLYTATPAHPDKLIASRTVHIPSNDFIDISFSDVQPFDVADSGQIFRYYFKYSAPDQDGKTESDPLQGKMPINPKIIRFPIYDPIMLGNLLLVLLVSLFAGIVVEWKMFRNGGR